MEFIRGEEKERCTSECLDWEKSSLGRNHIVRGLQESVVDVASLSDSKTSGGMTEIRWHIAT